MLTIISTKKLRRIEERLDVLENKMQNVEVEVFYSVADAEMPDGSRQRRVTLKGIVTTMYRKFMGIKEEKKPPIIHRV